MLLPLQTSGMTRKITVTERVNIGISASIRIDPMKERSCKRFCGDTFSPISDGYSTCLNFCECLWRTNNSIWTCILQVVTDATL